MPTSVASNTEEIRKPLGTRRVTLRDVADRAGVKLACVSVVINGAKSNAHVSPAARERILIAAEELGYKRNGGMAAVATGRFGCIALLLSTNPQVSLISNVLWAGVNDELSRKNIHLSIFSLPDEELTDRKHLPKILREWMADGMLIDYTHNIPDELKALIKDHALPAIWLNSKQEFDCVRPDDFQAGIQATEHLLKLGHKRIAYIDLDMDCGADESFGHYSGRERYDGYGHAMKSAGLSPQSLDGRGVHYNERAALIEPMLKDAKDRPTAIITFDSKSSDAVLWVCAHLGIEVPRELSLVSVGMNVAFGGNVSVETFHVPEFEVGKHASAMLLEKIADPRQQIPSRVIPFVFYEGNSTAPPAE